MGWVKIPFTHAFIYLLDGKNYTDAVRMRFAKINQKHNNNKNIGAMVSTGGDTDTTAAIVGGLIGAAEGYHKIPTTFRKKMLECDPSQGKVPRPDFLCPSKCDLLSLIRALFASRPDDSLKISMQ